MEADEVPESTNSKKLYSNCSKDVMKKVRYFEFPQEIPGNIRDVISFWDRVNDVIYMQKRELFN